MRTPVSIAAARGASAYGYASRAYADSLAEFGEVLELTRSEGRLLVRPLPVGAGWDGMGCYPVFSCGDWTALGDDLASLAGRLVCAWLVTDPLAAISPEHLSTAFPDVCYEYKSHFIVELERPLEAALPAHHRRNVRKSLECVEVRQSQPGPELLAAWTALYDNLIARHAITGVARFSRRAFERQMTVPGFAAYSAYAGDEVCGITLWYVGGDAAYYHLAAYSDEGYRRGASYALFWTALQKFARSGVRWAALGRAPAPRRRSLG